MTDSSGIMVKQASHGRVDAASADRPCSLAQHYRMFVWRRRAVLLAMAVLLAACFLTDIASGASAFQVRDILAGLFTPSALTRAQSVILWDVRLPYAVMAVCVGGALGLAGAEMQTVLNNPLASPFTLGVSAAATLGASLVIVFDVDPLGVGQNYAIALGAFLSAVLATFVVQALSRLYGGTIEVVVLFGIALAFAFNALVALVQFIADANTLQQVVFWSMGSLARANWSKIGVVAGVLAVCLPFSLRHVWAMTALRGGEEHARSYGIAIDRLRLIALLRVSLLAAVAVAFVGTIGFVGLVGPHMARLLLGEDHRFYLPGSMLCGAVLLSGASIASKTLIPGVLLPVGIVTALVGIPVFLTLILVQRKLPR
jgi:iron complex transport system permease protein